jgi:hypothetical protein
MKLGIYCVKRSGQFCIERVENFTQITCDRAFQPSFLEKGMSWEEMSTLQKIKLLSALSQQQQS